jgi:hypothetical protein
MTEENFDNDFDASDTTSFDTDFDVDADYKPEPLVVGGSYFGTIKEVKLDTKTASIVYTIVLDRNPGAMCSDDETAVDGIEVESRVWLPRPNDKNELNRRGTQTKYQSKINMMKQFSDRTGFNIGSLDTIKEAIAEQEWIGAEVVATVGIELYEGRQFNRCNVFSAVPE